MAKGFTLVELSIVLVIVGLLIGGILVAKSMVETTKINGYVYKLQQYDIAVNNFITTYKSVPGDSPLFTPAGCNVGRHMLRHTFGPNCGQAVDFYDPTEDYATFAHLSQANMIKGSYTPLATGGNYYENAGANSPIFAEDAAWSGPYLGFSTKKIPVTYHHFSNIPTLRVYENYLTPIEAVALDAKMDNGRGAYGRIETQELLFSGSVCEDYISQSTSDPITFPPDSICLVNWFPDL